jgi:hypothetical protein
MTVTNYAFVDQHQVGELAAAVRHAKGMLYWQDSEELAISLETVAKEIRGRLAHPESFDDLYSPIKESGQKSCGLNLD